MCSSPHCRPSALYTRTCLRAHVRHLDEPRRHSQQFPSSSSQRPREWQRRRRSPRAPATQTASSFSWVDDFRTTNEVYHSSFFLGQSLMIFNMPPHRLTQHLCFNLIHSEFVSGVFFLGLNPSFSSSRLLLPWDSITGLALIWCYKGTNSTWLYGKENDRQLLPRRHFCFMQAAENFLRQALISLVIKSASKLSASASSCLLISEKKDFNFDNEIPWTKHFFWKPHLHTVFSE